MRIPAVLILALLPGHFALAEEATVPPLKKIAEMPLPGVQGRIDHLALDARGERLLVAALGNDTVEVLDLKTDRPSKRLADQAEPQSVLFLEAAKQVVVSSGEGGRVDVLQAETLERLHRIEGLPDADNMRYDAATRHVYVAYGGGQDAGLAELDPEKGSVVRKIKLPGHPEAFALDPKAKRAYVNVPSTRAIQVVDLEKGAAVAVWALKDARANYPMALDEAGHRLFVGCRAPAKVLVYDTTTGACVANFDAAGDADDLFFDADRKCLFQSGGDGTLRVYAPVEGGRFALEQEIKTATGARTCLYVPDLHALFLAVPKGDGRDAAVWRFQTSGAE